MGKSQNNEHKEAPNKPSIWYGITNLKWLSIKFLYFFEWSALGVIGPFQVLYYASLGLTTAQIGMSEALCILISAISTPIIASVADKTGRQSFILGLCIIAFCIPATAVGFFSAAPHRVPEMVSATMNRTYNTLRLETCNPEIKDLLGNTTTIPIYFASKQPGSNLTTAHIACANFHNSTWSAVLEMKPQKSSSENCSEFHLQFLNDTEAPVFLDDNAENKTLNCSVEFRMQTADTSMTFLWICLLRSVASVTMGPFMTLSDAISYDMLGPRHRGFWGQQRMLGTFAWGVAAVSMGVAIDYFQNYKIAYITLGVLCVPAVIISFFWIPKRIVHEKEDGEEELPFCQALRKIFASPVFCTNCVVSVASGALLGIFMILLPQSLGELGAPNTLLGLASVVMCAVEIPSLFFAGALVSRLGEIVCFLLMFLAFGIRFSANAFLTPETVWLVLPIETVHFFSYALYFSAATRSAANVAPPGTSSTVQGILATSYYGIGTGLGVFVGSLIYNTYGRQTAFLTYAAFALLGFVVLLVFYFAYLRKVMAKLEKLPPKSFPMTDNRKLTGQLAKPNEPLMAADVDEL